MQLLRVLLLFALGSTANAAESVFEGGLLSGPNLQSGFFVEGDWSCDNGVLTTRGSEEYAGRIVDVKPLSDVVVDIEASCGDSPRRNFGLTLRAREDGTRVVVRYYDRKDALEVIFFDKGKAVHIERGESGVGIRPGVWHRFKAAAVGDVILAKCWPSSGQEPDWQVRAQYSDTAPGLVGVIAHDGTYADFRSVRVAWGDSISGLREEVDRERRAYRAHLREDLSLEVEATPFVLRDSGSRQILLRTMLDGKVTPVNGSVTIRCCGVTQQHTVAAGDYDSSGCLLPTADPEKPTSLHVVFDADVGTRLEAECQIAPAKQWTFYMTPHTHYDIGFTHPQPEVIAQLAEETNRAIEFCEETADWPVESRYRWTVEVTSLADHFIKRYPDQVDRFVRLVREGRIEICGYYLNMPTELTGHEETIRCLYYAQELREAYNVPIDTVMIDDVPGYAWTLADLLPDAGMPRASFRANSIRGQFLWNREGAVPRPFYWEGPAGNRLFTWYTDSYREGNFFREPGLHEERFLGIIRRNEAAGAYVTDIQLRMGGDNLPPDIDASRNARAWNEKYLWPRVVVATNREFLDTLEAKYGDQAPVVSGDIPSWWAEGPASTAAETGMNRLMHDRLSSAEALWTLATLCVPDTPYPRDRIRQAYDYMIHFDEHTWGANVSISAPDSEATRVQWQWKANQAHQAAALTTALERDALDLLAARIPAVSDDVFAVCNTTAAPGDGLVALRPSEGFPVSERATRLVAVETGEEAQAQWDAGTETLYFRASNVPAFGFATYRIEPASAARPASAAASADEYRVENDSYRLTFSPESGAWTSFYDKRANRELLDSEAEWSGNQPIREIPIGGRGAIDKKRAVDFERTPAAPCRPVDRQSGPVYESITFETSLPGCPRIRQTYRLFGDVLDIENVFVKEDVLDPEAISIAFPFAAADPVIRVQIADAVMRPGVDQLPYSCHDFYSIQHWAAIADDDVSILWMPVDAPLVSFSDLNMYRWADTIPFDRGHVYSLVMNNCWMTNFRASQSGELRFRYRIQVFPEPLGAARASVCAQRSFNPLVPVKPTGPDALEPALTQDFVTQTEGEPVTITCVKRAESSDDIIVRLVEMDGHEGTRAFRFNAPAGYHVKEAYTATPTERPLGPASVQGATVTVSVPAMGVVTLGVKLERSY